MPLFQRHPKKYSQYSEPKLPDRALKRDLILFLVELAIAIVAFGVVLVRA